MCPHLNVFYQIYNFIAFKIHGRRAKSIFEIMSDLLTINIYKICTINSKYRTKTYVYVASFMGAAILSLSHISCNIENGTFYYNSYFCCKLMKTRFWAYLWITFRIQKTISKYIIRPIILFIMS